MLLLSENVHWSKAEIEAMEVGELAFWFDELTAMHKERAKANPLPAAPPRPKTPKKW